MSRRWILGVFAAVCAAQIAVPALMIRTYEATLTHGRSFKVKCRAIDPVDAFRGRYVRVGLLLPAPEHFDPGDIAWDESRWATLEEGPDGFARAASIERERPARGDAVRVRYAGRTFDPATNTQGDPQFRLEIDRYYMTEAAAPEAEKAYRQHVTGSTVDADAEIRVLDGVAIVVVLRLAGIPIEEYLRLPPEERPQPRSSEIAEPAPTTPAPPASP